MPKTHSVKNTSKAFFENLKKKKKRRQKKNIKRFFWKVLVTCILNLENKKKIAVKKIFIFKNVS